MTPNLVAISGVPPGGMGGCGCAGPARATGEYFAQAGMGEYFEGVGADEAVDSAGLPRWVLVAAVGSVVAAAAYFIYKMELAEA